MTKSQSYLKKDNKISPINNFCKTTNFENILNIRKKESSEQLLPKKNSSTNKEPSKQKTPNKEFDYKFTKQDNNDCRVLMRKRKIVCNTLYYSIIYNLE